MKLPISIILLSILALVFLTIIPDFSDPFCFFGYSILVAICGSFLLKRSLDNYNGLNFSLLFLLGYYIRVVIPGITMPFQLIGGESFSFLNSLNVIDDYLFPTTAWMNIFYMLFFCILEKTSKGYTIDDVILPYLEKYNISRISIILFVVGFIYNVSTRNIPAGIIPSFVDSLFGELATLAIVLQVFNSALLYSKEKRNVLVFLVITEMARATLFDFYKSAIMMPFILFMLYSFMHSKHDKIKLININNVLLATLFFALISFVVYPFMNIKRVEAGFSATVGGGIATSEYSNFDILNRVISGDYVSEEENQTFDRFNAIPANAYFYKESVTKNMHTTDVLKNNLELLVPKFLNPKKHGSQAGLMAYAYAQYGSFSYYSDSLSNNYIGQFASSYLIGGILAVIICAILNGFIFGIYYNFMMQNITNVFAMYCLARLFMSALFSIEEIHDGGGLRMGLMLVYMIIVVITNRFFRLR